MTTDFTALASAISTPLTCERSPFASPMITNLTETQLLATAKASADEPCTNTDAW